jgi:hypothetical protein
MRPTPGTLLLALALTLPLAPAEAGAQRMGQAPQSGDAGGWAPAAAGFRVGYDSNERATVLGVQLRIPALPSGLVEIVPTADVTFVTGLREYQAGVDVVVVSGGRRGGVYAGGGWGMRNTIYEGPERDTRRAFAAVFGLKTGALGGSSFGTQIEMRWVYPDGPFRPKVLSLGVNFPLWGRGDRR